MTHSVFAIVAPVARNRLEELQSWLDHNSHGATGLRGFSFHDLDTVHFAGVVVFPPPDGDGLPDDLAGTLVFETCVDGAIDAYLDTLVHVGLDSLIELFRHCLDYEPRTEDPKTYLRKYLRAHVRLPHLYHVGTPRMSTHQIAAGGALRGALDRALDQVVALGRAHDGAPAILDRLRRRLRIPPSREGHWHLAPDSVPDERYAWYADPAFPWISRLWPWARLGAAALLLFAAAVWAYRNVSGRTALLAAGLLALTAWAIWRWLTGRHPPRPVDARTVRSLTELEDIGLLNHMTSLAPLKRGLCRRVALRVVLWTFNLAYRTVFTDLTPGRLMGLPTIHFAQWTSVPYFDARGRPTRHRGLLFLSNYDGSWETYLDDFLAHLMRGVVLIWANTAEFPWPLDSPTFKRWARSRMSPWQVWHQHACYERLTIPNIHNNEAIRKGLLEEPASDHAARMWLARFGALQTDHEPFEETRQLEEGDIQGLVLSGFASLDEAVYVLLEIADGVDGAAAARRWLEHQVLPRIESARESSADERRGNDLAVNIAFTWRGLRKLGLDPSGLDQFPLVFKEGMAPDQLKHRSRILGDVLRSDPSLWDWGSSEHAVDVLLMVFMRPGSQPRKAEWELLRDFTPNHDGSGQGAGERAGGAAGRVVAQIDAHLMRDPKEPSAVLEHFGFRDGLSDPVLEGSWRARRQPLSMHLSKPGEFLLGYPAADGTTSPTIAVRAEADRHDMLPPVAGAPASRDFGSNGTYLVCRQLAQHVGEFRNAVAAAGGGSYECAAAQAVAARVVGRWRDGTPTHGPDSGHGRPSNEFGFADDPHGFGCPIGAHIRRANPRDSLGPDVASALRSVGRHRMLRRGRPYGPPLPDGQSSDEQKRGLVFICLNGDIERQFEFVQQNWIANPAFSGLYGEADPLIGGGPLTVQAAGVRRRITGLGEFVTVHGGQYFFLPGLSALRYLATGPGAAVTVQAAADLQARPVAAPAVRRPSRLRAALTVVEMVLPWLRTAWAVRVPLLLLGALMLFALAPRLSPAIAPTLFLAERARGVFAVALLASLATFVAMVTFRIVLLYGERLGLARARWTGPARWPHVLGFQTLALPVVWAVVAETVRDREAAGLTTFWAGVLDLTPAAVLGSLAGLACMWLATSLQALKPGARPELFFPPNPLARWMGLRGSRINPPRAIARLQAACAAWIVDGVPQSLGAGYIDYRRRGLLSGHAFALSLALVVLALYVAGFFLFHPAYSAAADDLPPIAFLIGVSIAACWLLSGLTFFFDRYHVPTLGVLVLWLAIVGTLARTDHHFEVKGPVEVAAAPADPSGPVVVVAAEGLGLVSSAWTAEVLTGLSESLGPSFTGSLRLVSAASGASLGTVYFVDEYTEAGFGGHAASHEMPTLLEGVRVRARTPGSGAAAWGLAYPDLVRLFAPVFVPRRMDRDWAREIAWRRALDPRRPEPTLSAWRRDVAKGWRPAVAFGVTVVESGERGLLATYQSPSRVRDVTGDRDVSMLTAARLSAAFPLVSAAARPDTSAPAAFHVTDGGYWDNSGIVAAIEWLEAAKPTPPERVIFVEVRSSSRRRDPVPENASWLLQLTAPLRTLIGVRYDGQPFRNEWALDTYSKLWEQRHGTALTRVTFQLRDDRLPLTWNLGQAAPAQLTAAWRRSDVQAEVEKLRALLAPR